MDSNYVLPAPATPPRRPPKRSQQLVGVHFTTPQKKRPSQKDSALVHRPGLALQRQKLRAELDGLLGKSRARNLKPEAEDHCPTPIDDHDADMGENSDILQVPDADVDVDMDPTPGDEDHPAKSTKSLAPRRRLPDETAHKLYSTWLALIPTLVPEYLQYLRTTQGRLGRSFCIASYCCPARTCVLKEITITCLHFDYLITATFQICECTTAAQTLVRNGLFPATPSQPRMAVSIDLLEFYFALFERSADAVTAMAGALKTFYSRRGFSILNEKREPVQDPFRRGLGNAIQWYDTLRRRPDTMLELAIDECARKVAAAFNNPSGIRTDLRSHPSDGHVDYPQGPLYEQRTAEVHPHLRLDADDVSSKKWLSHRHEHQGHHLRDKLRGSLRDDLHGPLHDDMRGPLRDDLRDDLREPLRKPFHSLIHPPGDSHEHLRNNGLLSQAPDSDSSSVKHTAKQAKVDQEFSTVTATSNAGASGRLESCSRLLQKRCPACFGGSRFGRDFDTHGGDIHVALDATFSQRHNVAAGESPWFYEPRYFLSKEEVDTVGLRVDAARKKPPRSYQSKVPESALEECERSFEAADEKKEKTHGSKFDDTGLMALVCRHDIVLFLANVDTPGEQQKYGIALLERLFTHLPDNATVAAYYDVGCVLDRSLHLYNILPEGVVQRMIFAVSAMHAYGHQWSCQLVYNPRLREGLGLTEGEGTERVWSKLRKLIGVTRTSARSRRIWLLDRQTDVINAASRENLGGWIRSRLKNGIEARTTAAEQELESIRVDTDELRRQWSEQRQVQLSIRNHAPGKLKKELDAVLNLQTELDSIEQYLTNVQKAISDDSSNSEAHHFLSSLRKSHHRAIAKVEKLYVSLNVSDNFPELKGLPLEFVRTLLMARDLKINIRKRAIGTFFEWDKLDRAAGGRDQALGTKLHQQTRKAISKRTPALMTAIRKFNKYCDDLKKLSKPQWNFPLPSPLPTELSILREDSSLLTDVWITPVAHTIPRWLEDPDIRAGIRALLIRDRCLEERRRLGEEADNLCRWYGRELVAIELAMRLPDYAPLLFLLKQRKEELLLLQHRWRTPLVSDIRYATHIADATQIATRLSGVSVPAPVQWVHIGLQPGMEPDEPEDPMEEEPADDEALIFQDTVEAILDHEDDSDTEESYESSFRPPLPAFTARVPMLQRDLWIFDENPFTERPETTLSLPPVLPSSIPQDPPAEILIPPTTDYRRILFYADALERFHRPHLWLSDDCINEGVRILLRHYGTNTTRDDKHTVFSTYVFSYHRDNCADDLIWRSCRDAQFWTKDIWIIPIHHDHNHWTLAIVYWKKKRIAYFDSLAKKPPFEAQVQMVFTFIHRLNRVAEEQGYAAPSRALDGKWQAYPLVQRPLQHNHHDCGVWVLACIAALMRGYTSVRLSDAEITDYRKRILSLVYTMATAVSH